MQRLETHRHNSLKTDLSRKKVRSFLISALEKIRFVVGFALRLPSFSPISKYANIRCSVILLLGMLFFVAPLHNCHAGATGLPIPRFVSLRSSEINLRRGPGTQYPIDWIFVRSGLPVEIISEFETWRKIKDVEGTEGWVHQSMLSGKRTIMTPLFQNPVFLMKHPDKNAPAVARIQGGVIGHLKKCKKNWCLIHFQDFKGWLQKGQFWGVKEGEKIG